MGTYAAEYLLFLLKTVTVVAAMVAVVGGVATIASRARGGGRERLEVKSLNDTYERLGKALESVVAPERQRRRWWRRAKKEPRPDRRRVYVLDFQGDVRASSVGSLRQAITAVLLKARDGDEVVMRLESLGGLVAAYGLAAAQVARIKSRGLPLTICVDRVAASGGYMMACIADRIIAAPFAVVGSIGVVAQLPNFHRLLKRHHVDYELFKAGEHKRTVTLFGETTDEDRQRMQEQVEEAHVLFKAFVGQYRPDLDLARVSTGEHWYGSRALELGLVDELRTSDDLLTQLSREANLFEVRYTLPQRRRWWPQ